MISVVICTRNRSQLLISCIESLIHQIEHVYPYEIIIADNGSTDTTKQVIQGYQNKYSNIRYLFEPKIGLSITRNSAAKIASYEYLAYVDDDGKVKPDFILQAEKVIHDFNFICFGGWFIPWYRTAAPKWLPKDFGYYPCYLKETGVLPKNLHVPGGIFFITKSALQIAGGFPESIGMRGNLIGYGEENYVQDILQKKGISIGFSPQLILEHLVAEYKFKLYWHLKRQFAKGRDSQKLVNKPKVYERILFILKGVLYAIIQPFRNSYKLFKSDYYFQNFILDSFSYSIKLFGKASSK